MILYHLIKVSMSQFDRLPNDVIVYLAFDYDLPTIVAFCRSSKRFNKLICQNNNFSITKPFKPKLFSVTTTNCRR